MGNRVSTEDLTKMSWKVVIYLNATHPLVVDV